jgi:hypothetical protein
MKYAKYYMRKDLMSSVLIGIGKTISIYGSPHIRWLAIG